MDKATIELVWRMRDTLMLVPGPIALVRQQAINDADIWLQVWDPEGVQKRDEEFEQMVRDFRDKGWVK